MDMSYYYLLIFAGFFIQTIIGLVAPNRFLLLCVMPCPNQWSIFLFFIWSPLHLCLQGMGTYWQEFNKENCSSSFRSAMGILFWCMENLILKKALGVLLSCLSWIVWESKKKSLLFKRWNTFGFLGVSSRLVFHRRTLYVMIVQNETTDVKTFRQPCLPLWD
jgi:hypothetical protein